jgi:putative transposase
MPTILTMGTREIDKRNAVEAVADGVLGFWQAIEEVWPKTRGQRCWVHKTANVLNKLPKSQHSKAKRALQEIWMAETKKDVY